MDYSHNIEKDIIQLRTRKSQKQLKWPSIRRFSTETDWLHLEPNDTLLPEVSLASSLFRILTTLLRHPSTKIVGWHLNDTRLFQRFWGVLGRSYSFYWSCRRNGFVPERLKSIETIWYQPVVMILKTDGSKETLLSEVSVVPSLSIPISTCFVSWRVIRHCVGNLGDLLIDKIGLILVKTYSNNHLSEMLLIPWPTY